MARNRGCSEIKTKPLFDSWRANYYREYKRNPYAYQSFKKGYELASEQVLKSLQITYKGEFYRMSEQKKEMKKKDELIFDMMHLAQQFLVGDVTEFTRFNMTLSVAKAKTLLNMDGDNG